MKNIFLSMFAVAVCGAMTASAIDATSAQVTLVTKGAALKVEKLGTPPSYSFPGEAMKTQPVVGWQVVNIPVKLEAKSKKKDEMPNFIPSLKVKAHLLIECDTTKEKMELLTKEIEYRDIPVAAGGGDDSSRGEMCVGVFISPSSAVKLQKKAKGDLKGKLLGVAIEAIPTDKVKARMNTDEDCFIVFDNKTKGKLPAKWWTRKVNNSGAVLNSVNETPYAPFIGNFYPATEPRFGSATGMPQVPATTEDPALDATTTPVTATPAEGETGTAATDDTTSTDTPAAAEDTTTTSKGRNKNKKSTRRGSRR